MKRTLLLLTCLIFIFSANAQKKILKKPATTQPPKTVKKGSSVIKSKGTVKAKAKLLLYTAVKNDVSTTASN